VSLQKIDKCLQIQLPENPAKCSMLIVTVELIYLYKTARIYQALNKLMPVEPQVLIFKIFQYSTLGPLLIINLLKQDNVTILKKGV